MKIIIYYSSLIILLGLLIAFLLQPHPNGMAMAQMVSVSILLGVYVVAISFVGEGTLSDEREAMHRYHANRSALVVGTVLISIGILYQLFASHHVDGWLLGALIAMNVVKVVSLLYAHYKN